MLVNGIKRLRDRLGLWTWLYLLKLISSLFISLPLLAITSARLDQSVYASALRESWSLDVLLELLETSPDLLPIFLVFFLFMAAVVFIVKQFLNGGIYTTLVVERRVGIREFFGLGGEQFGEHVKISLVMIVLYVPTLIIALVVSGFVPVEMFGRFGESALLGYYARFAVIILIFAPVSIFSDILRLHVATNQTTPLLKRLRPAFDFYRSRFVKLVGIYLAFFLPFVGIWAGIELLALWATSAMVGMIGILIELVLFQFCSWLKTGQSLAVAATAAPIAETSFAPAPVISVETLKND